MSDQYDRDIQKMLEDEDIYLMAETLQQCRRQWAEDRARLVDQLAVPDQTP